MMGCKEGIAMRTGKPISVTLGSQQTSLERRLRHSNASEVLRQKVEAAMADKRPSVPAEDVFKRLRGRHQRRMKAAKRGA